MTDSRMTPVPSRALADLWDAMDRALEGMECAQQIEKANHEYDPDCECEHCSDVGNIDRLVGKLVVDAALGFRIACAEAQPPVAKLG